MKTRSNLALFLAALFFIISTAFTYSNNLVRDPYDCNLCDAVEKCTKVNRDGSQVGKTDCDDDNHNNCNLSGYYCWSEPE
ncbi:MAG: hypothetical protein FH748_14265 [Balneolaceae bacterium]|nr:hypothetical protein [Balneolaceae bacterium]